MRLKNGIPANTNTFGGCLRRQRLLKVEPHTQQGPLYFVGCGSVNQLVDKLLHFITAINLG